MVKQNESADYRVQNIARHGGVSRRHIRHAVVRVRVSPCRGGFSGGYSMSTAAGRPVARDIGMLDDRAA